MANRIHEEVYYRQAMRFCRTRREELGKTQQAVASAMDISDKHCNRLEKGESLITDGALANLLKILGAEPTELQRYVKEQQAAGNLPDPAAQEDEDGVDQEKSENDRTGFPPVQPTLVRPSLPSTDSRRARPNRAVVLGGIALLAACLALGLPRLFVQRGSSSQFVKASFTPQQPGQPIPPGLLEKRLVAANVQICGPEATPAHVKMMVGHLQTDLSLQALSETLLRVLSGRRFKEQIHLDTLWGCYKESINPVAGNPDAWHPAPEQCTNVEVLKRACLQFWNARYPNAPVQSFEEMIL